MLSKSHSGILIPDKAAIEHVACMLVFVPLQVMSNEFMKHRRSSIACTTAAVPPTAGQLVTSERGVCGAPLAFHYANLMTHTAFRQSLACVGILYHYRQP
jgi:hypothetical protein